MSELPETLYLSEKTELSNVLLWGKSPLLMEKDIAEGVARLGGWRLPNYEHAYVLAANTLLRTAIKEGTLDHHGLPIFFLQRHATELLMKKSLQLGIDIQDHRERLGRERPDFPSHKLRKRASESHDLKSLRQDLETMVSAFQLRPLPTELGNLVDKLIAVENGHTWARYSFSASKQHLDKEVTIPLSDIQEVLQATSAALGEIFSDEESLNSDLFSILGELWAIEDAMRDEKFNR